MELRICQTCDLEKPVEQFATRRRNRVRDGIPFVYIHTPHECKQCEHAKRGTYRKTDMGQEVDRRSHAKYYAENKDGVLAKYQSREFKDTVVKKYLQSDKAKARTERYHNSEKGQIYLRNKWARRRVVKYGKPPNLTLSEWRKILTSYQNSCAYCGSTDKIVMEHVVPLAIDGRHSKENVVPACTRCNQRKGVQIWEPNPPFLDSG